MQIYDRWGKLIFEKTIIPINSQDQGWNGTIDGSPLKTGAYIYSIDVRFIDNATLNYQGTVTLIR